jgi:hypothetical protein
LACSASRIPEFTAREARLIQKKKPNVGSEKLAAVLIITFTVLQQL